MQSGATAEVEVTVRNDGTNTWQEFGGSQAGYRLGRTGDSASFRFDNSNGDANVHDRAFIDAGRTVPANGSYTFTFTITAPAQTGAKVLELRMVHDGVAWFGDTYSWNIEVVSGAGSDPERVIIAPESLIRYPDLMNTALPNADYYVAKKAFFWDLSPDAAIAPIDDRSQPLGTDVATLQKLLRAQASRAGNSIYTVSGFVPWHLKYTSYADPLSNMDPVPSEWKMIDIISAYHGQLDADAMGMVGLSNASVFSKVPLNSNLTQSNDKGASNTLTYRADTDYIMFYMGDFDAGAWTSGCLPLLWDDPKRGELPLAWPVCADLANRVPQVFNYLYETAGENDYFVSGDNGTGYLNPMFLEGDKVPSGMSNFLNVWKAHNIASNERFDIDITGFLIAGNAGSITPTVQAAYHEISPQGVVYQGSVSQAVYQGTPFAPYWDIGGEIEAASADSVADDIQPVAEPGSVSLLPQRVDPTQPHRRDRELPADPLPQPKVRGSGPLYVHEVLQTSQFLMRAPGKRRMAPPSSSFIPVCGAKPTGYRFDLDAVRPRPYTGIGGGDRMRVDIKVDENCREPRIVILTDRITEEINALVRKLTQAPAQILAGFAGEELALLQLGEIIRIYGESQRVYAQTTQGRYALKQRLYELEEGLDPSQFVRISHSEIINLRKVRGLDLSLAGSIRIRLEGDVETFVSRRYVTRMKRVLGL